MTRLTKEQIENIKELSNKGIKQEDIAKEVGTTQSMVSYYSSEETRKNRIESSTKRFNSLSKEEKHKIYVSRRNYNKEYNKRKYNSDSLYRKKIIERVIKWRKKNKIK